MRADGDVALREWHPYHLVETSSVMQTRRWMRLHPLKTKIVGTTKSREQAVQPLNGSVDVFGFLLPKGWDGGGRTVVEMSLLETSEEIATQMPLWQQQHQSSVSGCGNHGKGILHPLHWLGGASAWPFFDLALERNPCCTGFRVEKIIRQCGCCG